MTGCNDLPEFEVVNTQDPNSDYFLDSPKNMVVEAYDDHALIIYYDQTSQADSIIIIRTSLEESAVVIAPIDYGTSFFIDSAGIIVDKTYNYELRFLNEFGVSMIVNTLPYHHEFAAVDSFFSEQLNEHEVRLHWTYCYDEHFAKEKSKLSWRINKAIYNESFALDSAVIDTLLGIEPNCNYSFIDQVELGDSIVYTIQLKSPHNLSQLSNPTSLAVDFPQLEMLQWIPINAQEIFLNWRLENVNSEYIQSVLLTSNLSEGSIIYQLGNELNGVYLDDISTYAIIDAGQSIRYTLTWCGPGGVCDDTSFVASTFPFHNMEYVPGLTNVIYGAESNAINVELTEPFYIDIYEVSTTLFDDPGLNSPGLFESLPKDSVNFYEARTFCNDRSTALNAQFNGGFSLENTYTNPNTDLNYDETNIGFHIANELEWEIAASIQYDLQAGLPLNKFSYPVVVGDGELSCYVANYLGCFDESTIVGFFNGDNYPYENAPSPVGLYDVSGNVKEWVEKYFQHEDSRQILRGGDFLAAANECKTTSYIYETGTTHHRSIGFRTAIAATPFLEEWYEWIGSE